MTTMIVTSSTVPLTINTHTLETFLREDLLLQATAMIVCSDVRISCHGMSLYYFRFHLLVINMTLIFITLIASIMLYLL